MTNVSEHFQPSSWMAPISISSMIPKLEAPKDVPGTVMQLGFRTAKTWAMRPEQLYLEQWMYVRWLPQVQEPSVNGDILDCNCRDVLLKTALFSPKGNVLVAHSKVTSGNYTQYFVITSKGKESEKNRNTYVCLCMSIHICVYIYVHITEPLCCTPETRHCKSTILQ